MTLQLIYSHNNLQYCKNVYSIRIQNNFNKYMVYFLMTLIFLTVLEKNYHSTLVQGMM